MTTADPASPDATYAEVTVHVPTEHIASFYTLVGEWLRNPDVSRVPRRRAGGRRRRQGPSASRYAPIGEHLASLNEDSAAFTFQQLEDLIEGALPASAHKHRAWWANTETHSQAVTWIRKGWLVDGVDLDERKVTFRRA